MILICAKSKTCKNYLKNKKPWWDDGSKGKTLWCDSCA